jgi:uncharacterized protein (DUF58 family)
MPGILPFLIILLVVSFFTQLDVFFYLLYVLFGIYIFGRLWVRRSLAAVTLQRRHNERVFLDEPFSVDVEVRNQSWLPVLWLRLTDTVPGELSPGRAFRWVVSLLPRERLSLQYRLYGRRRGYYELGPFHTLGGDLLGLATYEASRAEKQFVIVYPKIVALHKLGFSSQSPFGSLPSRERIFEDPTRIQGVRDYQPGDSLRKMDWKTSARVGSLQVRRYEPTMALDTALFLNLDGDDYTSQERHQATELGIVVAASLAVHLVEKRQAVALFTNGCDPLTALPSAMPFLPLRKGRQHLMGILDLLARIEVAEADRTTPFLDLLGRKSLGLPWGSTVVVVTAREAEGLFDTLLTLRRRGLFVILVLTAADGQFALTARRAAQIGIESLRIDSEQALDVWR